MTNQIKKLKAVGNLFIISAPSGAGKTSLTQKLIESFDRMQISISHTTRTKRDGEADTKDYYFTDQQTFEKMIAQDEFLEYANVFGNYYGTTKRWVADTLNDNIDVVLEIDWQGARQVRKIFPEAVNIFILPPSKEELKKRLVDRKRESEDELAVRIDAASIEVQHCNEYEYLVINNNFHKALQDLHSVIKSTRLRVARQIPNHQDIFDSFTN